MWPLIIALIGEAVYIAWIDKPLAPLTALAAAPSYIARCISPPSPSNAFVPSTVPTSPVIPSIVPIIEDSCPVSDFTSTLWFCPSATATATAPTTATTTSAPVFLPSNMAEQPVTTEAHASGLPSNNTLDIAIPVVLFAALIFCFWYGYKLGQVKVAQRLLAPPEETSLSCCESIVANTPYDWHNSDSLGSKVDFPDHVLDIALREWHAEKAHEAEAKWNDREEAHQIKIDELNTEHDDIKAEFDERVKVLEVELAERKRALEAKITENKGRESDHQAQIAAKERAHKHELAVKERAHEFEIKNIDEKQKRISDRVQIVARIRHRAFLEEKNKRKAAERKLDTVQKGLVVMLLNGSLIGSGLSKPPAQDAAHDSTTDQLLLGSAAANSSITEAAEASFAATASPVATPTPELDPTELKAETSPQDVAPGNGDQLPSPPTLTESLITEAKDASPAATESTAETSATSPSESGAEQQQQDQHEDEQYEDALEQQHEHEEEQKEEVEEQEPHITETPLQEPSSMGEGAEQSHQEKDVAHDAPVPTEVQAASPQLAEPEAASNHTTSSDSAFEAPVTTEVLSEEQTGDRQTEEPTAVEENVEAPGITSSNDGASIAPVTNETKTVRFVDSNGHEVRTAEEIDQTTPVSTGQNVHDEPVDEMDVGKEPGTSDHPGYSSMSSWEIFLSSQHSPNATTNDLDDESEAEWSNETDGHGVEQSDSAGETYKVINSPDQNASFDGLAAALAEWGFEQPAGDMDIDDDNGAANNTGAGQSNSTAETQQVSHIDNNSNGNAVDDLSAGQSHSLSDETSSSEAVNNNSDNVTANDTGAGQSHTVPETDLDTRMGEDSNDNAAIDAEDSSSGAVGSKWLREPGMDEDGADDATNGTGSQPSGMTAQELAQPSHQAYGNGQGLPFQINSTPATETAQFSHQAYGNGQGLPSQINNTPATETAQFSHQAYGNGQGLPFQINSTPATETAQFSHQAYGNGQVFASQFNHTPATEIAQFSHQAYSNGQVPPFQKLSGDDAAAETSSPAIQDYSTDMEADQENETPALPEEEPDSELDEISDEQLDKMMEEVEESGELSAAKPVAVESSPAESDEQPHEDSEPVQPRIILAPVSRRKRASLAQPQLQTQGVQSTQQVSSQPTPTPQTETHQPSRTEEKPELPKKDVIVEELNKINRFAVQANAASAQWMRTPDEGGPDDAALQRMRDNPDSQFANIIEDAKWNAEFLENGFQKQLDKSPLSAGAEKVARDGVLPAVESMREKYGDLNKCKNSPHLFMYLLMNIDRMLKVLRDLVPGTPTPPAQAQQPALGMQSTQQQFLSRPTPTPQTGTQISPPLASTVKDWPLHNAQIMNTFAVNANRASREWLSNPEYAGLDGNTFQQARNDPNSQFSKIIQDAANWARYLNMDLKDQLKRSPLSAGAETVFRHAVPAVRIMREQYNALSQSKGVPHLFMAMLRDIDCILMELSVLVPGSATPPAQHQPSAQSTQQGPSQPTPQTAGSGQQSGNYLFSYGNPLQAATVIKTRVLEIDQWYVLWDANTKRDRSGKITSKGTDAEDFAHWDKDDNSRFRTFKRQVRWTANWLKNRGQRHPQAEHYLRDQVLPLMKHMRDKTYHLGHSKGCAPIFNDLLDDFLGIVKELKRIN